MKDTKLMTLTFRIGMWDWEGTCGQIKRSLYLFKSREDAGKCQHLLKLSKGICVHITYYFITLVLQTLHLKCEPICLYTHLHAWQPSLWQPTGPLAPGVHQLRQPLGMCCELPLPQTPGHHIPSPDMGDTPSRCRCVAWHSFFAFSLLVYVKFIKRLYTAWTEPLYFTFSFFLQSVMILCVMWLCIPHTCCVQMSKRWRLGELKTTGLCLAQIAVLMGIRALETQTRKWLPTATRP